MSAGGYLDGCGFIPVSTGTGNFVVSAAIQGYQTPAGAGAVDGTVYTYRAESADKSQWEIGFGAYTVSGTTLARTTQLATSTGGKVSFSTAPNVFVTAAKADLQNASLLTSGTAPTARLGSGTANSGSFLRGDQTWAALPSPAVSLLETLTPTGVASISSAVSWAGFSSIEIRIMNAIPATTSQILLGQFVTAGGTQSASYTNERLLGNGSTAAAGTGGTNGAETTATSANTAAIGASSIFTVFNPNSTTMNKTFTALSFAPATAVTIIGGIWAGTAALTGVVFSFGSGNITSAVIKIYGIV